MIWSAGRSHQFNKNTVVEFLRKVVTPAFRSKRKRLGLNKEQQLQHLKRQLEQQQQQHPQQKQQQQYIAESA